EAIERARPDVVISTVAGDTNVAFYRKLAEAGLGPREVPVIAFAIAEDELRHLPARDMAGDYAAWNYFQSLDTDGNREFVRKFKDRYSGDRVTSDVMAAAYNSVWLWAQAVSEAETDDIAAVLKSVRKQSMSAPEGIISVDGPTLHTWRPVYIGRIRGDGQFDIVWNSGKAVRPIPFPTTRSRGKWEERVDELHRAWDGRVTGPCAAGAARLAPAPGGGGRGARGGGPGSGRRAEPPATRRGAPAKAAALRGRDATGIAGRRAIPPR